VKLLVVGGRQKRDAIALDEWERFERAVIAEIDVSGRRARCIHEYVSPIGVTPKAAASILFKAATLSGEKLFACTQTEILIYRLRGFEQIGYFSHPRLNDVHHVRPRSDGTLLVANTGLDCVLHLSSAGDLLREWPVLPTAEMKAFRRDIDFRAVPTTKPHAAHPNFVFEIDGRVWATRFVQRDAICVEDLSQRMPIGTESPHDGVEYQGEIYFTTVDGQIVVVNTRTRQVVRRYNLNASEGAPAVRGWCRGLSVLRHNDVLVGFSRIRPTRFRENVRWVAGKLGSRRRLELPTHVARFDLASNRCVETWDVESAGVNAIFSIHALS
jgi:hypothetical protein